MHQIDNTTNLGGATVGKRISNGEFQKGGQPTGGEVFDKELAVPESDGQWPQHLVAGVPYEGRAIPGSLEDNNQGMLSLGGFTYDRGWFGLKETWSSRDSARITLLASFTTVP